MRRIIIAFILMAAFALFNILTAYGAEWKDVGSGIRPLYEETASYFADFDIDSNGNAEIKGNLKLLGSSVADKVSAVVKITNTTTGKVPYNKTITMTYSKTQKKYVLDENYRLQEKGTHRMYLTYKCCSGNKLLESIQVPTQLKVYA